MDEALVETVVTQVMERIDERLKKFESTGAGEPQPTPTHSGTTEEGTDTGKLVITHGTN